MAAAKKLGKRWRGTVRMSGSMDEFAFAQRGCVLCTGVDCLGLAIDTGAWWNPKGMDEQEHVQYKAASAICFISKP